MLKQLGNGISQGLLSHLRLINRHTKDRPKPKQLSCIWADRHLVVFHKDQSILMEGDCGLILTNLGKLRDRGDRLQVHYQGTDLLILPPLPTGQSRAAWLKSHLPKQAQIEDYLLAFCHNSEGPLAMVPRSTAHQIFACSRSAGFSETTLLAMPADLHQACTLQLASGLWHFEPDQQGVPHFWPLPNKTLGRPPQWLQPIAPIHDFRATRYQPALFTWRDEQAHQQKLRRSNRQLLGVMSLAVLLLLGSAWLWMGWRLQRSEDRLVQQVLDQKSQNLTQRQFKLRRKQLIAVYAQLAAHPFAQKSDTFANRIRKALNACPESLILARVQYQMEYGAKICFMEGFSPDPEGPLRLIKNLQHIFTDETVDLIKLAVAAKKQTKTDRRLNHKPTWYTFTIRIGDV